jgi:hypothetical protein
VKILVLRELVTDVAAPENITARDGGSVSAFDLLLDLGILRRIVGASSLLYRPMFLRECKPRLVVLPGAGYERKSTQIARRSTEGISLQTVILDSLRVLSRDNPGLFARSWILAV